MSKNLVDSKALQDEHLDIMIRLAFQYEDFWETQELLQQSNVPLSPEEEAAADRAFITARKRIEANAAKQRRVQHRMTVQRALRWGLKVAVCIILITAIAVPIAIANVESLRSQVMQLLITIDNQRGSADIRFTADDNAAFDVPTQWEGMYFPSYIPEGFIFTSYFKWLTLYETEYVSSDGKTIYFTETDENIEESVGVEDAIISYADIDGKQGFVRRAKSEDYASIIWANDVRWFEVQVVGLSDEELIRIACSVKPIIR